MTPPPSPREFLDWYLARGDVQRVLEVDLTGWDNRIAVITIEIAYRGEPETQPEG